MKESEKRFLLAVASGRYRRVRDACNAVGNYKQNWYYLEKWCRKDWYDYGVTIDLGWLTDKGKAAAAELAALEGINEQRVDEEGVGA